MLKLIRKLIRRAPDNCARYNKSEVTCTGPRTCQQSGVLLALEEASVKSFSKLDDMASDPFSWLHTAAPAFPIQAHNVQILKTPNEFYQTLMKKCSSAQHRITLASLYLGTGTMEKALVETIHHRMQERCGELKVTLLFDHSRGSRGNVNSRTMVAPLLKEKPDSCQVSLYHTVILRGLLRRLIPQRYNELLGLQHMKLYIFDDSLIISGANLSNDYFTNRQDRYVLLENCKDLADFYGRLVSRVCEFSFQLQPDGATKLHPTWSPNWHPFNGSKDLFVKEANSRISRTFFETRPQSCGSDTWIFPLVQMGQLGIRHDSEVTLRLLEKSPSGSQMHLATGYFNLTKELINALLHKSQASFTILSAHPTANGFLNARGPAGGIPAAYTQLAKAFFKKVCAVGQEDRIEMREFIRPGWTYHAKGLWLTLPGHVLPSLSLIGSPNFGARSVERDLETQIVIVTRNPHLQSQLADERDQLFKDGITVNKTTFLQKDRVVPTWVYCASWLFKNFF